MNDQCWICHDEHGLLVKLCICNNLVHPKCLDEFRYISVNPLDETQCRICGTLYNLQRTGFQIKLSITDDTTLLVLGLMSLNVSMLTLAMFMLQNIPDETLLYGMIKYYIGLILLTLIDLLLMAYVRLNGVLLYYTLILVQTSISLTTYPLLHYHITLLVLYNFIIQPGITYHTMINYSSFLPGVAGGSGR